MDLTTLRTLVRELVGDPSATSNTYSDTMVTDAINYACLRYAEKTGRVTNYTGALSSDANAQLTSSLLPADYLEPISVQAAGVELDLTSPAWESMKDPAWRSATGTAKKWFEDRGKVIQLVPKQVGASCIVRYVAAPTTLVAGADQVDSRIPVPHQVYLKYAAAAWLLTLDGDQEDVQKSVGFMGAFDQGIGATKPQGA